MEEIQSNRKTTSSTEKYSKLVRATNATYTKRSCDQLSSDLTSRETQMR